MIDHVSIPVADLERAAAFYDAALEPLGLSRKKRQADGIGYGRPQGPSADFWILQRGGAKVARGGIGLHISFVARSREEVDAFYARAMAAGGKDAGAPGERPEYTQPFYGAFVRDLDGFKVEAVCRDASGVGGDPLLSGSPVS